MRIHTHTHTREQNAGAVYAVRDLSVSGGSVFLNNTSAVSGALHCYGNVELADTLFDNNTAVTSVCAPCAVTLKNSCDLWCGPATVFVLAPCNSRDFWRKAHFPPPEEIDTFRGKEQSPCPHAPTCGVSLLLGAIEKKQHVLTVVARREQPPPMLAA